MSQFFSQFLALGPFATPGLSAEYDSALAESAHTLPMRIVMGTVIFSFALIGIWVTTRLMLKSCPKRAHRRVSITLKWDLVSIWFLCASMMALSICVFLNIGG